MRIVYVLTSLGIGGAERQVISLATRMEARGHAVALLVLRPQLEEEWPTSVEVFRLGMKRNPFSVMAGLLRARKFLRDFSPDVVHSHSFHANFVTRILKFALPSMIVVSTIHNVYEGGRARMLAYRFTDGLSRLTIAVSNAAAERFIQLKAVPRSKIAVITNGIDTVEFAPRAARRIETRAAMDVSDEFVWLTAGRMTPAKDIPNLLRAFGIVSSTDFATQLWMAGQAVDDRSNPLRAFVVGGSQGFMDRVRWLGLRRDMPALLDAADGFVLASAWEGMPLAVGEAMAMEKPVVATNVGGVRELVGDAGLVVPAHDPEALAAAMMDMMHRPSKDRCKSGEAARMRIATQFSMDTRADVWERLYARVLSSRQ
jgi:glycosyltransferase involved in cell wall biosynthesis